MKKLWKWIVVILSYVGFVTVLDWVLGISPKDPWDHFADWAKK